MFCPYGAQFWAVSNFEPLDFDVRFEFRTLDFEFHSSRVCFLGQELDINFEILPTKTLRSYSTFLRSSKARIKVSLLAISKSPPTGNPRAIREIFTE